MSSCNGNCSSCGSTSCGDRTAESLLAPEHIPKDQIRTWCFPKERRQRRLSLENEKSRVLGLGGTLGSSWGSGRGPFRASPDQKPPASGFWRDTLWTLRHTISFPAEQQAQIRMQLRFLHGEMRIRLISGRAIMTREMS